MRVVLNWAVAVWTVLMTGAAAAWLVLSWGSIDSTAGVLAAAVGAVVVGAILTVKVPSNSVGPLSLIAGSSWVIYLFGNAYAVASLGNQGPLPGAYVLGWAGAWTGAFLAIGISTMVLVFPTGKPFGWWRLVLIAPAAASLAIFIGAGLLWGLPLETLVNTDRVSEAPGYPLIDAAFITGFVSAIPATLSVVARFRRAGFVERQQIKWLLAATSLFALVYVVAVMSDDSNEIFWWILSFALLAIPLAILFAVLRYGLYEIDRVVSRSVSYAVVVGLLAAVFFGTVTLLTSVLPSDSDLVTASATLLVAGLFNPVRKRVQLWVDRRFNRSRYDAQLVMDGFAGSLQTEVDPDQVVEGWVSVVSSTMQPKAVGVWINHGSRNDFGTLGG